MKVSSSKDITNVQAEAGVIASLICHPEYYFHMEELKPEHFSVVSNQYFYAALVSLAKKNHTTKVKEYDLSTELEIIDQSKNYSRYISLDDIRGHIDSCDSCCKDTPEGYIDIAKAVVDMSFRRDVYDKLGECQRLCGETDIEDIQHRVYSTMDNVLSQYSAVVQIPQFKDVVDGCWERIKLKKTNGYSGIPFKFKSLNDFATIEPGELFLFAAEAKQGKSIMLLNCAVELLKMDKKVLYLDSEIGDEPFTSRMLAHLTGMKYRKIKSLPLTEEEDAEAEKWLEWIKTKAFTHLYMPAFDVDTLYTTIKRVSHTQGIDVLIVDYFKSSGEYQDAFATYQEMGRLVDI